MPAIRCLVLLLAALIYAGHASAKRSRLTQEADVVEAGDCEVESAGARERARGKGPARESNLELNCGVGASTEVSLLVARRRGDDGRGRGGRWPPNMLCWPSGSNSSSSWAATTATARAGRRWALRCA